MNTIQNAVGKMTNYRWTICAMLFFATTVNYLDRQVLSLTWKDFIAPEFHWTYGDITAIFSLVYAIANLFAGRFIDWMGTKKGYLWAIAVWSLGACLHALCGWATEHVVGIHNAAEMISATGAIASTIAITSVYFFNPKAIHASMQPNWHTSTWTSRQSNLHKTQPLPRRKKER